MSFVMVQPMKMMYDQCQTIIWKGSDMLFAMLVLGFALNLLATIISAYYFIRSIERRDTL